MEDVDVFVTHRAADTHIDGLIGKLFDDTGSELDAEASSYLLSKLRVAVTRKEFDGVDAWHCASLAQG